MNASPKCSNSAAGQDQPVNPPLRVPLPPTTDFASYLMMKDINIFKQNISDIRQQINALSNTKSISNEVEKLKETLATLITKESHGISKGPVRTPPPPTECLGSISGKMRPTPVHAHLPASNLRITIWNCLCFSAGLPYAEVLAESSDILIISEHWFRPFEVHKFQNIHLDMNSLVVTNKRLNPECTLTRGCGGVGIA